MIQIKNPCDANWKEMTPADSGKYCGACEKVVVDFSKMNDAEIKNYFTTYKEQKTCGRFLDSQLERPLVVPVLTPFNKFLNRLNQIPVARTVLLFLTSTSMWISSCVKNNNEDMITGDSTAVIENSNTQLMADTTVILKQHDSLLIKPKREPFIMGEIAETIQTIKVCTPSDFLMGDVAVEPDEPDTVIVTIPATTADTNDTRLHMMMGKVMMADTISQKIKRRK